MRFALLGLLALACSLPAQPPNPAFTEVPDTPGLPRVLLIGDSISIGYTLPVRELPMKAMSIGVGSVWMRS